MLRTLARLAVSDVVEARAEGATEVELLLALDLDPTTGSLELDELLAALRRWAT